MAELNPCKFCGKSPKIYPLITRFVIKDVSRKISGNIYKTQTERIEVPAFYTVSCQNEKCKSFLHKFPNKMISEDSINGAILKWNQQN